MEIEALESRRLMNADPGRLVISVDPLPMPTPGIVALIAAEGASIKTTDLPNTIEATGTPDAMLRLFAELNGIPSVHAIKGRTFTVTRDPNDTSFVNGQLYGLKGPNSINAPAAWDLTTGSTSEVVASIDTGVDYNHPDLYQNIWLNQKEIPASRLVNLVDVDHDGLISFADLNDPKNIGPGKITDINGDGRIDASDILTPMQKDATGKDTGLGGWADGISEDGDSAHIDDLIGWNFVTNTNNPLDDNGHGSHTSGTMAAMGNNGLGVVGVNWTAEIMVLKFLASNGSGSDANAASAVRYATDHGAKVTNNSYGDTQPSPLVESAIQYAQSKGSVFVAAAGNSAANNDTSAFYPANFTEDNVIAVAATDQSGVRASFSNYGATKVALGAPGVSILSTVPGGYATFSGTSMASPHVAGAVALVQSLRPDLTYKQVIAAILNNVTPDTYLAGLTKTGGLLNIGAAINSVAPINKATFLKADTTTQGTWKPSYGGDGFVIAKDPSANNPTNPAYATVTPTFQGASAWSYSTSDVRALQTANPTATDRIAGTWYAPNQINLDVHINDGKAHQVAIYAVDYDHNNRAENVSIIDDATGLVLDTRSLSSFDNGVYLVWSLQGNVTIRVNNVSGPNAVVSGIFFGNAPVALASANFLKADITTQGTWKPSYGGDGFVIAKDPSANNLTERKTVSVQLS